MTLANLVLYRSMLGDAPRNRLLFWNVLVKCGALLLNFVFPPTMLIVTLLAASFSVVMGLQRYSRDAQGACGDSQEIGEDDAANMMRLLSGNHVFLGVVIEADHFF